MYRIHYIPAFPKWIGLSTLALALPLAACSGEIGPSDQVRAGYDWAKRHQYTKPEQCRFRMRRSRQFNRDFNKGCRDYVAEQKRTVP